MRRAVVVLKLPATPQGDSLMKYVLSWFERPAASYADYEAAQHRVLDVFLQWKMPESIKFLQFVVRVGEWGGYMVVECDKLEDIHKVTTMFAVFEWKVEAVLDVMDAVAAEKEAMADRDAIDGKK